MTYIAFGDYTSHWTKPFGGLSGTIPSELGLLTALQVLVIGKNTIPKELNRLIRLKLLDVSDNDFTGPLPLFLASLAMEILLLESNSFSGSLTNATLPYKKLTTLQSVGIVGYKVRYQRFFFGSTSKLQVSNAYDTLLEGRVEDLMQTTYLRSFNIFNGLFTGIDVSADR